MADKKRELIDPAELIRYINETHIYAGLPMAAYIYTLQLLTYAPRVDAVEVVHARWVSDEGDILFHCSECETQISTSWDYDDLHWNYCPNCGASMRGDGNV